MMKKRVLALALALLLCVGLLSAAAFAEETAETLTLAVGTTGYGVTVGADYHPGERTDEDKADDMIAYFFSDEHLMDFDLYQFGTEGQALADYAAAEAAEYGAAEIETLTVNDIPLALYYSEEEYDGVSYRVANYLFEAEDLLGMPVFAELSFWLDGEDAEALVEEIVASLSAYGQPEDDTPAVVLEKLPGEDFTDKYLVQAENGVVYMADFIGFKELEAGSEVLLSVWGWDYRIETLDPWEAYRTEPAETPAPLLTTAAGVEVRDLDVRLVNGLLWNFAYTLSNPTDQDAVFDQTLFRLETASGQKISTAAALFDPETVHAGLEYYRVSIGILSGDLIQLGDEISFYYDGTLLGTATAGEF